MAFMENFMMASRTDWMAIEQMSKGALTQRASVHDYVCDDVWSPH